MLIYFFNDRAYILYGVNNNSCISYVGYILNRNRLVGHNGGGKNCQRRVLSAAYLDLAMQTVPTSYDILFHLFEPQKFIILSNDTQKHYSTKKSFVNYKLCLFKETEIFTKK